MGTWAKTSTQRLHHRRTTRCSGDRESQTCGNRSLDGARTIHQRKVYERVELFKAERKSEADKRRSGRPSTSRTGKQSPDQGIHSLKCYNQWITLANESHRGDQRDQVVETVSISCESTQAMDHNDFGYRKVCRRWVSKQASDKTWTVTEVKFIFGRNKEALLTIPQVYLRAIFYVE